MPTDLRQSEANRRLMKSFGAAVEDLGNGEAAYVMRPKFPRFISAMLVQRNSGIETVAAASRLGKRAHSVMIKMCPRVPRDAPDADSWRSALEGHGFVWDTDPVAPTSTLIVDLAQSEEDLLSQMKPKTRYNVRLAIRRGVTTEIVPGSAIGSNPEQFEAFYRVYAANCERIKMQVMSRQWLSLAAEAFGDELFAVICRLEDGEIGGVAAYCIAEDTVSYQINGTTEEGRRDFAANLAVWEGMLESRRRGCVWFDFDGVYDDRYSNTEWEGFSRFKLGFGGEVLTFLGSYKKMWPLLRR